MSRWFVYLVRCSDGTYYTGVTTDVERRVAEHNGKSGMHKGAKYTQSRRPVMLVYQEAVNNRSLAQQREYVIRRFSSTKKQQLSQSL